MAMTAGARWIRFVRQYGPISRNDNMYDEHIRKSAHRAGMRPLAFRHPIEAEVLPLFQEGASHAVSVILTGTAGDGKSHLCGKIWAAFGGDSDAWASDDVYHARTVQIAGRPHLVHVVRDLTALPSVDPQGRYREKNEFIGLLCGKILNPTSGEVVLLAANDGQLMETLHRLPATPEVQRVRAVVETLLVEDRREVEGVPLRFFNLSRVPCRTLFDLALDAFLNHEGWQQCYRPDAGTEEFFGARCPIRHNYELLREPLVRRRIRALFELCDCSDLHVPIRRILLLLANAVLGHPDAKDRLLQAADVPGVIHAGTVAKASLFNNIFGGNLTESRREGLEVFEFLNRFRIGHETSNRADNILIFGEADENLRPYFDTLLKADPYYGADASYYAAQRAYVEGAQADDESRAFLELLISQRRGLFFKIPESLESELSLWELTVFKYAGEYLSKVVHALRSGARVERHILARLIKGLNRVFVGMLVNSERELLLVTSVSYSTAKVSQVLADRLQVSPRLQERVELVLSGEKPALMVQFAASLRVELSLNLTRFEFLSRVAEGALPGSFSRECYEDMLAFKSKLLSRLDERRRLDGTETSGDALTFRLLALDANGQPLDEVIEVARG